jgi:hypothetical protein
MAPGRPLAQVKNFGPVTLAEFHALGLFTLEQLEELGFEEVCRKWVERYPERLNANAFLGVVTALEETVWTQASQSQKAAARRMAEGLRHELGRGAKQRKRT